MPKYIYNSAEFTPISFKDRIAPYALYVEDYDKQQKDYLDMIEKTGDLDALKDLPMDSEAYGVYSSWKNDIDRLGSIMSTEGLTPEARALALSLKQRQALDIAPLLKKQKIRSDLTKEKRAYLASNPNSFYDIDIETTPLSEITDSMAPRVYNLDTLQKSFASNILGSIQANNGVDSTDYNQLKQSLGYDKLSKEKQTQIDNIISTARSAARSAYDDAQFERYVKEKALEIKETNANRSYSRRGGSGSSSSSTKSDGSITMPFSITKDKDGKKYSYGLTPGKHSIPMSDGSLVDVEISKTGIATIKDATGTKRVVNIGSTNLNLPETATEKEVADATQKLYDTIAGIVENTYYGAGQYSPVRNNDGTVKRAPSGKVIVEDDSGNQYIYSGGQTGFTIVNGSGLSSGNGISADIADITLSDASGVYKNGKKKSDNKISGRQIKNTTTASNIEEIDKQYIDNINSSVGGNAQAYFNMGYKAEIISYEDGFVRIVWIKPDGTRLN